jgi:hypothetical protein
MPEVKRIIRIPTGSCGLSEPFGVLGYRIASIHVPGDWAAGDITFRGANSPLLPVTQVVPTGVNAGLGPDAVAADIQMANAVTLERAYRKFRPAKVDPIDISALLDPAATIDANDHGILWVFQKIGPDGAPGVIALQVDKDAADYTSAIAAWAQFAVATRAMPRPDDFYIPIGAVHVNEGGSGAFAWGTDSIAAETEAYHNFVGLPEVLVRAASLALDAGAATFTYGAVTVRLGTGLRVVATGKANVAITGSNVADGAVGAWLLYVLADDVEYALQLGAAYGSLALAQAAVATHRRNPMLALMGVMYVVNASGAPFVPGTTFLDAAGITTTFETFGPRLPNLYDDADVEVTVQAGPDRLIDLSGEMKELLTRCAVLQLRSGTSGTPVDQTANPDLEVMLETV